MDRATFEAEVSRHSLDTLRAVDAAAKKATKKQRVAYDAAQRATQDAALALHKAWRYRSTPEGLARWQALDAALDTAKAQETALARVYFGALVSYQCKRLGLSDEARRFWLGDYA